MPSKESLKRRIQLQNEVIIKQLETIDVLKRIIDKIYPKQSESFQDKIDRDISHPLPYKRTADVKDFCQSLTTIPSNLFKNHPQVTVCELEELDNGR